MKQQNLTAWTMDGFCLNKYLCCVTKAEFLTKAFIGLCKLFCKTRSAGTN